MSEAQRRELFGTGNIHVVGSSGDSQLKDVTSWKKLESFLPLFDLDIERFVQGIFPQNYLDLHLN
jgi:hypothetical protein